MKISLIKCSDSPNFGNEFIKASGVYWVHLVFPKAEHLEYNFFDSAIPQNYKSPPRLAELGKEAYWVGYDYILVHCGYIISRFMESALNDLSKIRFKFLIRTLS